MIKSIFHNSIITITTILLCSHSILIADENNKITADTALISKYLFKAYNFEDDSTLNVNVRKELALLQVKFESVQKEEHIALLEQDAEISYLKMKRQKVTMILIICAFAVAIILLVILSQYLNTKNKTNKVLLERNKIIEKNKEALDNYSQQLLIAKQQAEEIGNMKSEFMANMSHEIRTPLNSVIGFAELMNKSTNDPKHQSHLNVIISSGKTLLTLLNDILDLSKMEAGKFNIRYEPINLTFIINDVTSMYKHKAWEKGIELKLKIRDLPGSMILNELRMRQILINLVGNALKFTDSGHIEIRTISNKNLNNDSINLELHISDTGKGISEDKLEKIFDPFYQTSSLDNEYGTGLGLTITKRLVQLMNGDIEVSSVSGKGSKFIVYFPEIKLSQSSTEEEINNSSINDISNQETNINVNSALLEMENHDKFELFFSDVRLISNDKKVIKDITDIYNTEFKLSLDTKMTTYIASFVKSLKSFSNKYSLKGLELYCNELENNINNFEIEKIDSLLAIFDKGYKNIFNNS
mgnify:CR=1 FL=1